MVRLWLPLSFIVVDVVLQALEKKVLNTPDLFFIIDTYFSIIDIDIIEINNIILAGLKHHIANILNTFNSFH